MPAIFWGMTFLSVTGGLFTPAMVIYMIVSASRGLNQGSHSATEANSRRAGAAYVRVTDFTLIP
jgi:hypothetical protein